MMAKYWVFRGSPVTGYSKTLNEARKKGIATIKKTGREFFTIVESDEEPYDWKQNYDVIGSVVLDQGEFRWYPKSKKKDCRTLNQNGTLGKVIPRPKYW